MSVPAISSPPSEWTLADLLDRFGPIPARRIRILAPPRVQATEQDLIDLEAAEDRLYELVDGVLVEKVGGLYESYLACLIIRVLGNFVDRQQLGFVVGESGMTRLAPVLVRIPDVSFVSWDRVADRKIPRDPIAGLIPDLAVEVISKSNTQQEMDRKLKEYFQAGVRLIWYVYPESRSVKVYSSPSDMLELQAPQSLDGGEVLPGFTLPLAELFQDPP